MNTWKRLDQLERALHEVQTHILDEKSQKAQDRLNPPVLTLSEDTGEPWLIMAGDDIERHR